ncbi:MAG TPA: DUF167 domain-containing protein [Candidatus Paceibacterota bacterium]
MKIFVKAKPSSKKPGIIELEENKFIVAVSEPPIQGRANKAIIKTLAEHFGTSSSRISLIAGFSSKEKIFELN